MFVSKEVEGRNKKINVLSEEKEKKKERVTVDLVVAHIYHLCARNSQSGESQTHPPTSRESDIQTTRRESEKEESRSKRNQGKM